MIVDIDRIINLSIELEKSGDQTKTLTFDLGDEYDNEKLKQIRCKDRVFFLSENSVTKLNVNDLLRINNLYDLIAEDIKSKNLSPYEQYICAYNIARTFKEYRYYKDNAFIDCDITDQSRNAYLIMDNEWMVCVGYVRLLLNILKRLDIGCLEWTVETENEYHDIAVINISDEKYQINGYYLCDPTADRNADFLTPCPHINMTFHEALVKINTNIGQEYQDLRLDKFYDISSEKKIKLYQSFDKRVKDFDEIRSKIDNSIPFEKTIDAFVEMYKSIEENISDEQLASIKKTMAYYYEIMQEELIKLGILSRR